jgi:EmrB/QacA subfamily drug resistance transporter
MGELSRRRRLLVLAICCVSLLMVGLDTTAVNVALPSVHRELGVSLSGLQWTIDAYTVVLASLLMLAGSVADKIGRRTIFQVGLVVFSLGSLLCGIAPNLEFLIAARVVQAIGGSMLNPVAMSIIRNVFDDPRERAAAFGMWGAVFGLSMALGPVVGGALVDAVSWRAIFYVNLPFGLAGIIMTARLVPESRAARPRRLDLVGQLLVLAGLGALTFAIIEGPRTGWASAETLSVFALAALCLISLVPYELRSKEPLLEMGYFRSAPFSGASAIAVLTFAGVGGFLFMNTFYLQTVRGLTALGAGLYMLPMAAMILVCAPISGRMFGKRGPRLPILTAAAVMVAAALMLTVLSPTTAAPYLLLAYLLFGIGNGLLSPTITNTAVTGMPAAQAGTASAIASTGRQVGTALGVAVIGAVSGSSAAGGPGKGFAAATHAGWWIIVALNLVILALGALTTGRWAVATAQRTAERLAKREHHDAYMGRSAEAISE